MKHILSLFTLVAVLTLMSNEVLAQDQYTYRNGNFAIRITTNPSGTEAQSIEYTHYGQWKTCIIKDRVPDNTGINYIVDDGRGILYSIYYEPSVDKVYLTNLQTEVLTELDRSQH